MEEDFRQATAPATTVFTAVFTAVSVLDAMKTVPLSVSPWLKVRRRAARFAGLYGRSDVLVIGQGTSTCFAYHKVLESVAV